MEMVRDNEQVLKDMMERIAEEKNKYPSTVSGIVNEVTEPADNLQEQAMGSDNELPERAETEVRSSKPSPSKRRHAGELQRLRAANEHAEQIAMQKATEAEMLRQELEAQRQYNAQLINHAQELKTDYAEGILKHSEKELQEALEHGDAEGITKILAKQREVNKLMNKEMTEKVIRENLPQQYEQEYYHAPQPQPSYNSGYDMPPENPHYYAWLDKTDNNGTRVNAWADPEDRVNYSEELVSEAVEYAEELNKMLKKKGLGDHIGTEEYYDIISNALDSKHGLSSSESGYEENQTRASREQSRPTAYAPANRGVAAGGGYISAKQGSKYTMSPEVSRFISKLSFGGNENMSEKEKYDVFMKIYNEDQQRNQSTRR